MRVLSDPLGFLLEKGRGRDLFSFRIGLRPALLVNHPAWIEHVLVTHADAFVKGPEYELARRVLGFGLLTSDGEGHRRHRQVLLPAFREAHAASLSCAVREEARMRSDRWRAGDVVDAADEMAELLITVIGRALLGMRLHDQAHEIRKAVTAVFEWFQRLRFPGGTSFGWLTRPNAALTQLDSLVTSALRNRETPFLAALDEAFVRGELSEAERRDEVLTFFMGAHETTATALAWTLYLLTQNPEAQDWIAAEQAAPARMVFAETLRLFPPAWAFSRRVRTPGGLGELELAPGTIVLLSPFVTQRDPRFFARPDGFEPLRWSEAARAAARFSYIPFGAGGRGCIGERWAWAVAETLLPLLLTDWRFRLAADAEVSMRPLITLRPRAGVRVQLERPGRDVGQARKPEAQRTPISSTRCKAPSTSLIVHSR